MTQFNRPFVNTATPLEPLPLGSTATEDAERYKALTSQPGWFESLGALFDDERETPTNILSGLWGAAYEQGSIGAVPRFFDELTTTPDAGFRLDPKDLESLSFGIDPEYIGEFANARSWEHAGRIREGALMLTESRRALNEAGAAGMVANTFASVVSPENVVLTLATMGMGEAGAVVNGVKTIRAANLRRATTMGLINAAGTLPVDMIVASENPDYNAIDVAAGFAGAFGFGVTNDLTRGFSRAQRFASGGLSQGLPSAAVSAFDSTKENDEIATMFAFNAMFGGAFNAIPARALTREQADFAAKLHNAGLDMADQQAVKAAAESGVPLTPDGEKAVADVAAKVAARAEQELGPTEVPPAETAGTAVDAVSAYEKAADADFTSRMPPVEQRRTAETEAVGDVTAGGAAFNPTRGLYETIDPVDGYKAGDAYFGNVTPGPRDWGILQWLPNAAKRILASSSMAGMVSTSTDRVKSLLGNMLGSFGLAKNESLSHWRKRTNQAFAVKWYTDLDPIYKEYVDAAKARGDTVLSRSDFDSAAGRYMDARLDGTAKPDAIMQKYTDAVNARNKDVWEMARRHDKTLPAYREFDRAQSWNADALSRVYQKPDMAEPVHQFLADAIFNVSKKRINELVSENEALAEFADKLEKAAVGKAKAQAQRIIANAGRRHEFAVAQDSRAFTSDARQIVEDAVRDTLGGTVPPEKIDEILYKMGPKTQERGPSFTQSRIQVDRTFSREFTNPDGTKFTLSVADLLENNVELLHDRLIRQATSHAGFQEVKRVLKERLKYQNEKLPDDWDTPDALMGWLERRDADALDRPPDLQRRDAKDLAGLRVLLRQMEDKPSYNITDPTIQTAVSILDNFNRVASTTAIGTFGGPIQNLSAAVDVLQEGGWKYIQHIVPFMPKWIGGIRDGSIKPSSAELSWALKWGVGTEPITNRIKPVVFDGDEGGSARPFSRLTHWYQNQVYRKTGNTHTQAFMETLGLEIGAERFNEYASNNKIGPRFLKEWGMSESDARRVIDQFNKHKKTNPEKGMRNALDPNVEAWTDPRAAAVFMSSLNQWASRVTVSMDPSSKHRIFTYPVFRHLYALRSWAGAAWDRRFLYNTSRLVDEEGFNARAGISYVTSMGAAATLYTLRTYIMSVGRPDQKEFLDRMLAPEEIAKSAFSKATWSSLMPIPIDLGYALSGRRPPFAPQRVSGLGDRPDPLAVLTSTPLGAFAGDASNTFSIPFRAFSDDNWMWNQQDARAAANLVPNFYNLRNFLSHAWQDLPRTTPNPEDE